MHTHFKNLFVLFALATNIMLASCQSEPVEPKAIPAKKTTETHPTIAKNDEEKPPKDKWPSDN